MKNTNISEEDLNRLQSEINHKVYNALADIVYETGKDERISVDTRTMELLLKDSVDRFMEKFFDRNM